MQTYGKKNQTVKEEECNLTIWKENKAQIEHEAQSPQNHFSENPRPV